MKAAVHTIQRTLTDPDDDSPVQGDFVWLPLPTDKQLHSLLATWYLLY
jgi:hypothetical protein